MNKKWCHPSFPFCHPSAMPTGRQERWDPEKDHGLDSSFHWNDKECGNDEVKEHYE